MFRVRVFIHPTMFENCGQSMETAKVNVVETNQLRNVVLCLNSYVQ